MNEVNAIFDALIKASELDALLHSRSVKRVQLQSVQAKQCGNCRHWMKKSCIPEKKHGHFKSMSAIGCRDFQLSDPGNRIDRLQAEITELDRQIVQAQGGE